MKIEFSDEEIKETLNALLLNIVSLEDVLKEGKSSPQEIKELKKERDTLSAITHKLTTPVLKMD